MTPQTLNEPSPEAGLNESHSTALEEILAKNPKIAFVRFQWQDLSGILRTRVVPLEHALSIEAGKRSFSVPPIALNGIVDGSLATDIDPKAIHYLIPDWASLRTRRLLDPLYATVMCRVQENPPTRSLPYHDICPRLALEKVLEKAKNTLHADFLVGFEVEFEVLKVSDIGHLAPLSAGLGHLALSGLRDPTFKYAEEAIFIMLDAGVSIDAFQTKGCRGQYEITLGPLPPIQAVDQLLLVHDVLKHTYANHELMVTMSPRPVKSRRQSNGQHAHLSIYPPHMECNFLAGILQRLTGLCAFLMPYSLSYERVGPYMAGQTVSWGTQNRMVPIRKIEPGHWEIRCADATANMYLGLAATIGAGLLGCINHEPLVWPDTGLLTQVSTSSGYKVLPRSLEEALELTMESQEELEELIESGIIDHFVVVKQAEISCLLGVDTERARELLAKLF